MFDVSDLRDCVCVLSDVVFRLSICLSCFREMSCMSGVRREVVMLVHLV